MFAKKRSIIKLQEILNPTYQIEFKINNEKYRIDIDAKIVLKLNELELGSQYQDLLSLGLEVFHSSLYRITVNKLTSNGFFSFEDYKEFNNYTQVINYLEQWKEKADFL